MCEVRVIIESDDGTVIETLDDVATIVPSGDSLTLIDLFGGQKSVRASFREIKLLDHTVVLTAAAEAVGEAGESDV